MPVTLQCDTDFPVTSAEVERLWAITCRERNFSDEEVVVRCVSESEIQELNARYREKEHVTNVLTFSYEEGEHDIALCLPVAEREAKEREVALRDYVALLLVHAFLHATGMDHERHPVEGKETQTLEKTILTQAGFSALILD